MGAVWGGDDCELTANPTRRVMLHHLSWFFAAIAVAVSIYAASSGHGELATYGWFWAGVAWAFVGALSVQLETTLEKWNAATDD